MKKSSKALCISINVLLVAGSFIPACGGAVESIDSAGDTTTQTPADNGSAANANPGAFQGGSAEGSRPLGEGTGASGSGSSDLDAGSASISDSDVLEQDSTVAADAAPDTGSNENNSDSGSNPSAATVSCGSSKTCDLSSDVCCVSFMGNLNYECKSSSACSGLSQKRSCDGPEDCSGGNSCCASLLSGVSCKSKCGQTDMETCHTSSDCNGGPGTTCKTCKAPIGGISFQLCVKNDRCPF